MIGRWSGERGALPLLAFAASRLWEQRDRERAAHAGGLRGDRRCRRGAGPARGGDAREDRHASACRSCASCSATWSPRRGRGRCATGTSCCRSSPSRDASRAGDVLAALIDARLLTSLRGGRPEDDGSSRRRRSRSSTSRCCGLAAAGALAGAGRRRRPCSATSSARRPRPGRRRGRAEDLLWTGTAYRDSRSGGSATRAG